MPDAHQRLASLGLILAALVWSVHASAQTSDRDCDDFATQSEAQAFFNAHNPAADPHHLDGNGDGQACENLPTGDADQRTRNAPIDDGDAYDRDDWEHWTDRDDDCLDTRDEVLAQESTPDALVVRDCEVVRGRWHDPYTGRTFTDPSNLHIDHVVPLKEAHISGGDDWRPRRRRAFANNLENRNALMAVEAGANMSKGADDPAEWLPPNEAFHCSYARRWIAIKRSWDLSFDSAERRALRNILADCRQR